MTLLPPLPLKQHCISHIQVRSVYFPLVCKDPATYVTPASTSPTSQFILFLPITFTTTFYTFMYDDKHSCHSRHKTHFVQRRQQTRSTTLPSFHHSFRVFRLCESHTKHKIRYYTFSNRCHSECIRSKSFD